MTIRIERAVAETADIRALIHELDEELNARYTPEQRHGISFDALFKPPVRFFVVHDRDGAQGCGGVALVADFAELKRMYVRVPARGAGLADQLLERLTKEAAEAGRTVLRLETGTSQERALGFYRRHGFRPCPAFAPYAAMPASAIATSVFMEKKI